MKLLKGKRLEGVLPIGKQCGRNRRPDSQSANQTWITNQPIIRKATPSLKAVANTMPSQAPIPARPESRQPRPPLTSPMTAPTKGPEQDAGKPEEHADDGADRGAPERANPGPCVTRAKRAGEKIHQQRQCGQGGENAERDPADGFEAADPGAEQQRGEYHRHARQCRHHRAGQPGQHQQ
jgi:hypothetical protein